MILGGKGKVGGAGPRIEPHTAFSFTRGSILGSAPPTFLPAPQDHPTIILRVDEIILGVDEIMLLRSA